MPCHCMQAVPIQESGRWEARPQRDGSTPVRLETHTNPGNNLPGWLVNPIVIKAAGQFQPYAD